MGIGVCGGEAHTTHTLRPAGKRIRQTTTGSIEQPRQRPSSPPKPTNPAPLPPSLPSSSPFCWRGFTFNHRTSTSQQKITNQQYPYMQHWAPNNVLVLASSQQRLGISHNSPPPTQTNQQTTATNNNTTPNGGRGAGLPGEETVLLLSVTAADVVCLSFSVCPGVLLVSGALSSACECTCACARSIVRAASRLLVRATLFVARRYPVSPSPGRGIRVRSGPEF